MTHGKASSYKRGCRCDECRAANAAYSRKHYAEHPDRRTYFRERKAFLKKYGPKV